MQNKAYPSVTSRQNGRCYHYLAYYFHCVYRLHSGATATGGIALNACPGYICQSFLAASKSKRSKPSRKRSTDMPEVIDMEPV